MFHTLTTHSHIAILAVTKIQKGAISLSHLHAGEKIDCFKKGTPWKILDSCGTFTKSASFLTDMTSKEENNYYLFNGRISH